MSRRHVAPLILLLAAACSIAAVFAVHRIEARGGPLSEPFASPQVSPALEGDDARVLIRFTTRQPEQITIRVLDDQRGVTVRTLARDERIDGPHTLYWDATDDDGRTVRDGRYRIRITRAGDRRTYEPARAVVVDATPPDARLDRLAVVERELRGLVVMEPRTAVVVAGPDGERLDGLRAWLPRTGTVAARTTRPAPRGHLVVRFAAPLPDGIDVGSLEIYAIDAAGNRTELDRVAVR